MSLYSPGIAKLLARSQTLSDVLADVHTRIAQMKQCEATQPRRAKAFQMARLELEGVRCLIEESMKGTHA